MFVAFLLSYLCGAIPFGVLVGRLRGVDVRAVGSGNIGATNVWRALGPVAGSLVFLLDVLKGWAGPLIGMLLLGPQDTVGIALCALIAVLGHTFSVFLGFKGGKGIATGLGVAIGMAPLPALASFALWGLLVFLTRMISAASIISCFIMPLLYVVGRAPLPYVAAISLICLVALLKHIPNIKRILAGTEPRLGQQKAPTPPVAARVTESIAADGGDNSGQAPPRHAVDISGQPVVRE
jgi:glycerol-3-phosphate acyltransferase PlsY